MLNSKAVYADLESIYSNFGGMVRAIEKDMAYRDRIIFLMQAPGGSVIREIRKHGGREAVLTAEGLIRNEIVALEKNGKLCDDTKKAVRLLLLVGLENSLVAACCDKEGFWNCVFDTTVN